MSLKLNFACGETIWPGFDNSDVHGRDGTSIVDLEQPPYPYEEKTAGLILISHGLWMTKDGHAPLHPDPRKILAEFFRILEPGGWLRIDDNPWRCYVNQFAPPSDLEERAQFPEEQRMSRFDLLTMLHGIGFRQIFEIDPQSTLVDADTETRAAIVGNQSGHLSFTVEARK